METSAKKPQDNYLAKTCPRLLFLFAIKKAYPTTVNAVDVKIPSSPRRCDARREDYFAGRTRRGEGCR